MTGRPPRARIDAGRRKEVPIFDSVSSAARFDDRYPTGETPGEGTFFCLACGSQLALIETDELPACPQCGDSEFRRDSIFEARQDHSQTTREFRAADAPATPSWLQQAREQQSGHGYCLGLRGDDGEIRSFPIERGWTRIGRSLAADVRLDDPSVSRRHALIVAEPGRKLRVLDDRSLNGVLLNGRTVEWASLDDGDELAVGRFRLYVLHR